MFQLSTKMFFFVSFSIWRGLESSALSTERRRTNTEVFLITSVHNRTPNIKKFNFFFQLQWAHVHNVRKAFVQTRIKTHLSKKSPVHTRQAYACAKNVAGVAFGAWASQTESTGNPIFGSVRWTRWRRRWRWTTNAQRYGIVYISNANRSTILKPLSVV